MCHVIILPLLLSAAPYQAIESCLLAVYQQKYTVFPQISAYDFDLGMNAVVEYMVVYSSPGVESLFSLNSTTGVISVLANLTSESQRLFYTLYIQAQDQPLISSQAR